MPFVTVLTNLKLHTYSDGVKKIERACKEAWVSMASGAYGDAYKEEDVGGVVIMNWRHPMLNPEPMDIRILFQYVDVGDEFYCDLNRELQRRLGYIARIFLLPTTPNQWFDDPIWSQAACQRPHREGLPPSGYDDGYA